MCSAFPLQGGCLLGLHTAGHTSISPGAQLRCPGYLITVLWARTFSWSPVLPPQETRKMEKGLAQDSELYQSDTAAGEVSPQTRRKQHGDRGGEIPPLHLKA